MYSLVMNVLVFGGILSLSEAPDLFDGKENGSWRWIRKEKSNNVNALVKKYKYKKRMGFADKCNKSKVGNWETAIRFHKCLLFYFSKCQQGTNSLNNEHTSCWQSRAPHNFIMSLLTKLLPDSYYRATTRLWCLNRKYMALRHWFGVVLHLLKRPCKGPVMTKLGVSDRSNVARSRLQLQIACMHRFCNALARPLVFSLIDSRCLQSGSNCRSLRCCDRGSGEPPSTMMSLLDGCENTWENENLIEPQLSTARVFLHAGLQWFNFTLLHPHHSTLSGPMLIFIAAASRVERTKLNQTAEQRNFSVAILSLDRRPRLWASFLLRSSKTPCLRLGDATCLPKGGDTMSTPPTTVSL